MFVTSGVRASKCVAGQSEQELAIAEADLLATLVEAYLTVILTEETVAQVESELTALELQLEEANALYSKSLLPVTQVLETQTRTDTLRADVLNASGEAAIARERLTQLVGIRGFTLQNVAGHFVLLTGTQDADSAARQAIEFDPATDAAAEALIAAQKGVEREKGSWFPEIDFVYNSQFSDVGFDNLTSPPRYTHSYSISMRYPLFEGGAGSARLREWAEFYTAQQQLEAANETPLDAREPLGSIWSQRLNAYRLLVKPLKQQKLILMPLKKPSKQAPRASPMCSWR